jgi:hypothetical protein
MGSKAVAKVCALTGLFIIAYFAAVLIARCRPLGFKW